MSAEGTERCLTIDSMKEMGPEGKCGRYRELNQEKKNDITLGFREEEINAAAAE